MEKRIIGRGLLAGAIASVAAFVFARTFVEPVLASAIAYEEAHAGGHDHGVEIFTRGVQANIGMGFGVLAFGVAMGALFAVAYCMAYGRVGIASPRLLSVLLAGGMFLSLYVVPFLKYPANPPGVGLEDTVEAWSTTFLLVTAISVVGAGAALSAGLARARRGEVWRASALGVGGYLVVTLVAMAMLPSFQEVPGPLTGPDGLLLDGFPAEVLADFRVYSLVNQALMWLVIGATSACLTAVWPSMRRNWRVARFG